MIERVGAALVHPDTITIDMSTSTLEMLQTHKLGPFKENFWHERREDDQASQLVGAAVLLTH